MMLTFNFKNSNDKSWFVNNLGRQLQKELKISYNNTFIYENTDEATYSTYEDLWKSEEEREQLKDTGVANKATRKVWSGDDGAPSSGNDFTVAKNNDILGIKLGKVFEGHGPICPHGMADIKYDIRLPKSEDIMIAQSGEQKVSISLKTSTWNLRPLTEALFRNKRQDSLKREDIFTTLTFKKLPTKAEPKTTPTEWLRLTSRETDYAP